MKILLHICCGPCGSATVNKLQDEGYEVIGYYYNPNIHPVQEYKKRLNEAKKLAKETGIELIEEEHQPGEYFEAVKGKEENQSERCINCWGLRLLKTALKAKELNAPIFATTLRISPYQNQENLLALAQKIALDNNLKFYETELTPCFQESIALSKEMGMYRQKYCGCIFSKEYR